MQLKEIVPWGRLFDKSRPMFGLSSVVYGHGDVPDPDAGFQIIENVDPDAHFRAMPEMTRRRDQSWDWL